MARERFPKARYARQLRDMREELWWWAGTYRQAGQETTAEWLQGRFEDRAAVLLDAMHWLDQLAATLQDLPRLR